MVQITNPIYSDEMHYPNSQSDLAMMQIDIEPETVFLQEDDIAQLQQKISDLRVRPNSVINPVNEDISNLVNYSQLMDIREPLSTLKSSFEHKLNLNLNGFQFWLQDIQVLERHQILVDQCFQSGGLMQINVQINLREKKINIVDVLKPH